VSKALQEICSYGLSCDGRISSNITGISNVRDETVFTDEIVILQVTKGYFTILQQREASIDIVSSSIGARPTDHKIRAFEGM
jgi:hypothetical protein